MAVAVWLMRHLGRPGLARTKTPEAAARDFARGAPWLLRPPPHLCHLEMPVAGRMLHRISAGPVATRRAICFVHGGAYLSGSPVTHAALCGRLARLAGVEVFAPTYRLLQQAPFPAAVQDVLAGWDAVLALGYRPQDVVIGGDSAGGGLALALLAELCAQGQRPAGLFAFSPWTDLTLSGDSLRRLGPRDPILPVERMAEVVALYLAGAAPTDPRASPLLAGFDRPPPVMIQVGAEEALLDDSRRMAARLRQAGGKVRLDEWPGAPHVWQLLDGWVPEARAALREVAGFVRACLRLEPR